MVSSLTLVKGSCLSRTPVVIAVAISANILIKIGLLVSAHCDNIASASGLWRPALVSAFLNRSLGPYVMSS